MNPMPSLEKSPACWVRSVRRLRWVLRQQLTICLGLKQPTLARLSALSFDGCRKKIAPPRSANSKNVPLIAIVGGSQGAVAVNKLVRQCAPAWLEEGIWIVHQTGTATRMPKASSIPITSRFPSTKTWQDYFNGRIWLLVVQEPEP